ncbi:uncharacterized protein B0T15DRAFT_524594 [Chaetomium strumarium]|uniref:Uncharacterized protein n=1 Tax=Chaetomium strumarium TaxID=1170767 RepID=A0AAJ0GYM0_9PEZI|nr:hypothetical protein B0T15DRAFT_524594 [Chaetomium strumarium]
MLSTLPTIAATLGLLTQAVNGWREKPQHAHSSVSIDCDSSAIHDFVTVYNTTTVEITHWVAVTVNTTHINTVTVDVTQTALATVTATDTDSVTITNSTTITNTATDSVTITNLTTITETDSVTITNTDSVTTTETDSTTVTNTTSVTTTETDSTTVTNTETDSATVTNTYIDSTTITETDTTTATVPTTTYTTRTIFSTTYEPCPKFCSISADTVSLYYWPTNKPYTYPATYYDRKLSYTFTSPSVYMLIPTAVGINSANQTAGPQTTSWILPLDLYDVSTIFAGTSTRQLTLNDLGTNCPQTVDPTAIASLPTECNPVLAAPTQVRKWAYPCNACGRFGMVDPPYAVPTLTGGLVIEPTTTRATTWLEGPSSAIPSSGTVGTAAPSPVTSVPAPTGTGTGTGTGTTTLAVVPGTDTDTHTATGVPGSASTDVPNSSGTFTETYTSTYTSTFTGSVPDPASTGEQGSAPTTTTASTAGGARLAVGEGVGMWLVSVGGVVIATFWL